MKKILIIHGPNLNLLGTREPEIYGKMTLKELNANLNKYAKEKQISLKIVQSNFEGEIIDLIQNLLRILRLDAYRFLQESPLVQYTLCSSPRFDLKAPWLRLDRG